MFRRKTLDQILVGFQDLKVELMDHVNHHADEATKKAEEVNRLNAEIVTHGESGSRAQRVIDNINTLVGA